MKGLIVAIQFLTRLPTPRIAVSAGEFAASMRWFPAVGLMVGALVAGAGWGGARIDPWTGSLAAVSVGVAVTGALNPDGQVGRAAWRDRRCPYVVTPGVGGFSKKK